MSSSPGTLRHAVRRELGLALPRRRVAASVLGLAAALGLHLGGSPATAQAPFRQVLLQGFSSLQVENQAVPALADVDADGDLDALIGDLGGALRYFANTRTASGPLYVQVTGSANPLAAATLPGAAAPELADLDGDLDLDAVVGADDGGLRYFENTRNAVAPAYVERAGSGNPFDGFDAGDESVPALADLDGDGDLDAAIGNTLGVFLYLHNTGSALSPSFTAATGTANPFAGIDAGANGAPALADIDGDGDLDALLGNRDGHVLYYRNSGTPSAPAFQALTGSANPIAAVDAGYARGLATPEVADLDGDGDLDVVLGEFGGSPLAFVNTGSPSAPAYAPLTGVASPFSGIDLGFIFCRPELADLDGDGDLDALTGDYYGRLRYFANTGAADRPLFLELEGSANPFEAYAIGFGIYVSPDLSDLDGDGDLDLVFGENAGDLNYLENTGTAAAPAFILREGVASPFDGIDFDATIQPELADLDGDGDLDLAVGTPGSVVLSYFANTGTSAVPAFAERTGSANPFTSAGPIGTAVPQLIDLDRDGDLDLLSGSYDGTIRYFANTGGPSAPAFLEITGAGQPFAGIDVGSKSAPKIADLDRDGDLDALVGEVSGWLVYHASTVADVFADGFESGDLRAWIPRNDL